MRYRNTKTGVVVEVKSVVSGKGWEPLEAPIVVSEEKPVKTVEAAPKKTTRKTTKKAVK